MKSIPQLKAQADDLFRDYIHKLYPDWLNCPTCDTNLPNKELTVGHAYARNFTGCRYKKLYATLQCWTCNSNGSSKTEEKLRRFLAKEAGMTYEQWELESFMDKRTGLDRHDFTELIEKLKNEP
jgi:hypothetical protein